MNKFMLFPFYLNNPALSNNDAVINNDMTVGESHFVSNVAAYLCFCFFCVVIAFVATPCIMYNS